MFYTLRAAMAIGICGLLSSGTAAQGVVMQTDEECAKAGIAKVAELLK
jgi:hypothetical protein